ncbi:hypothetical protein LZ318_32265 [Saccharopolyspora indica]|uniref:hypothetical protein n=1 Tax=Saccharopolyspora indica TaxID=1229659 RepID=UPI0022EA4F41|nr:hypothetical protein [Saccharopolyspora indica]MDA3644088.1 hypothetical protein [Saccharopolyspora indica]
MRKGTAPQRFQEKWSTLPLLLLGVVLIPLCLLPAHGIPGHPTTVPTATSTHAHEAVQAGADDLSGEDVRDSTAPSEHPYPGAPLCDSELDYSSTTARSFPDRSLDLSLLLLAVSVVAAAALRSRPTWSALLRSWAARPPWRPFGSAFLTLAGISRT